MLERQLLAYCFDRWVASGIDAAALPGKLSKVLDAVEHQGTEHFPYTLLDFIAAHHAGLLAGFFGLFEQLDADAQQYLRRFIHGSTAADADDTNKVEPLAWRLVNRLQKLVDQRANLKQKINQLKTAQLRLQKLPEDEATRAELDEVSRERSALLELSRSLNEQQVLNFLTDEGLLPNYAFPEEGVTLNSVILRRRDQAQMRQGESAYDKTSYSFQRSAQAALSELAPENRFYAVSHELPIDRVDLQLSQPEAWRFCSSCQYSQNLSEGDSHSACPRCGSPQWSDSGQKVTVLRLRQVYSTVNARDSRIGDDSEQRQPQFYNRQMLVDAPPEGRAGGFRIKSAQLPFGFEFLRRAVFREINFGLAGGDTHTFAVAGQERSRKGFHICRHCGTVQKQRPRKGEQLHAYTCKLRKHPDTATEQDYFDSMYLYRELESEAIRILLPLSEVAYSDEKLHSFIAALNLGLREYFHGDVHHLEVTDMREPGHGAGGERIYLVVYDRIPGGTGYLKELMRDPSNLMRVLELALARLTSCSCIDDAERDGCYRCILAYRDSRNMATISRAGAASLLKDILALRDQLEPVTALSDIGTNALVESQLEQKFVDALAALPGAQMTPQLVHGKPGSMLTLPGGDGRPMAWLVEHQVRVGPVDKVALHTEIDVLLTPARTQDKLRYRPIAVYLDGLQYHHERVDDDVRKRSALLLSGCYWVYTLNWDDLPAQGHQPKLHDPDLLRRPGPDHAGLQALYDGMARQSQWVPAAHCSATLQHGSLTRLDALLRQPEQVHAAALQVAAYRVMTLLAPKAVSDPALLLKLAYEIAENAPAQIVKTMALDSGQVMPGGFMDALANAILGVEVTACLPLPAIQQNDGQAVINALRVHLCFDDRDTQPTEAFKAAWRAFWHAANQLQYLPGFSMATRRAVADGSLEDVWRQSQALREEGASPADILVEANADWSEVFEFSTLEQDIITGIMALGVPKPEVGMDLAAESGEVVLGGDLVELCWYEARVAVVNEGAPVELPAWRLIKADAGLLKKLAQMNTEGIFNA